MDGSKLSHVFSMRSQQWTVSVDEPTTIRAIISLIGSHGLQNEKVSFVVTTRDEPTTYRHPTTVQNVLGYGDEDPVEFQLVPKVYYTFFPYSKHPEHKGSFSLVLYAKEGKDLDIVELKEWPYSDEISSQWTEKNAMGAQPNPGWEKNPHFALRVNRKRNEIHVAVMLQQARNPVDIIPFQVVPYASYMGFHIYRDEKHVDKLCDSGKSWLNAREVWTYVTIDGTKTPKLILIPTTFKPEPNKQFMFKVYCSNKLRLNALTSDMKDIIREASDTAGGDADAGTASPAASAKKKKTTKKKAASKSAAGGGKKAAAASSAKK